jgi:hypothetical protein
MRKSEVYSWRVSPAVKSELEEAARRAKEPVSKLLDRIVTEWLRQFDESADDEEQRRLHAAALKAIGTIRSGDPARASEVRARVRQRLRARRDR